MNLLGDGHEGGPAGRAALLDVGIYAIAILANIATGHRTVVNRYQHLFAGSLGHGEHERNPCALCAGKTSRAILRAVVIGEDFDLIVRRERTLNSAQGVVHFLHHIGSQALIDDKSYRKRERIRGEKGNGLARIVLEDLEVAVGEAGYQFSLRVLHGDRNFDEIYAHHKFRDRLNAFAGGGCFRSRGLHLILALIGGSLTGRSLARGRRLLSRRIGGRCRSRRGVPGALPGSNRAVHVRRERLRRLRRWGIGHGGLLLLGQSRHAQAQVRIRAQTQ